MDDKMYGTLQKKIKKMNSQTAWIITSISKVDKFWNELKIDVL